MHPREQPAADTEGAGEGFLAEAGELASRVGEGTQAFRGEGAAPAPEHSSQKRGMVGRPSIPIHRPGIGFGNEVGFGTIR